MKILLTLVAMLLCPATAYASGFGWYVRAVKWDDISTETQALLAEANEVISSTQPSPVLRRFLQEKIDEKLYDRFCNSRSPRVQDLTPRHSEFYPVNFIRHGAQVQQRNGVKDSIFFLFTDLRPHIAIAPRSRAADDLNPYFVISPQDLAKYQEELRKLNLAGNHPEEFVNLLMHLEAVLMLARSDAYPGKFGQQYKLQTALFFCGHD